MYPNKICSCFCGKMKKKMKFDLGRCGLLHSLAMTEVTPGRAVTCTHPRSLVMTRVAGNHRGQLKSLKITSGHESGRVRCSHLQSPAVCG